MKRADITDKDVCEAYKKYSERVYNSPFPYQILAAKFGCGEKLAYSACERAKENGLVDYGVSLRTGWLTEKGKALERLM